MFAPLSRLARALLAAGLLGASTAQAADVTLRFATINLPDTPAFKAILEPFARAVEDGSDRRIAFDLKGLGGFGKTSELFNMAERGDIEIAATVQGYNPGRFPRSSVMELPLMFDDADSGTKAMWTMFQEGLIAPDYASVKVLGLYVLPPYGIFTAGKPIHELKDFRGLRVRTPSPTVGLALARLGMIPVGIPTDMIGTMLSGHVVDAGAYGWDSATTSKGIAGGRLIELIKVMVDTNFAAPALMVVMNKAKWDALPPDLQATIERHMPILTGGNARLRDDAEAATKARLAADPAFTVVPLTPAMRADMEKTIQPAVAEWKASMTRQGIDGELLYRRARELVLQSKTASR